MRAFVTVASMRVHVVDHPLVSHKLTRCGTSAPTHRRSGGWPTSWSRCWPTRRPATSASSRSRCRPRSPTAQGVRLAEPKPLVVPILRAGLGMLDGMMRLLPTAEVGFLGMVRNEETLKASTYAERLPEDLSGRQCYVLDPMLATGGTLAAAIRFLVDRGADHITAICLLAAPEGVRAARAGARGARRPGHRRHRRRWTSGSTTRATSCPGSATPATGCTASPADPVRRSPARQAQRATRRSAVEIGTRRSSRPRRMPSSVASTSVASRRPRGDVGVGAVDGAATAMVIDGHRADRHPASAPWPGDPC